ncbi:stalk domain-containing protein [Paenibacillus sp. y28]|uniref:stalk domain-containing protein n=1 Tax=Paenibacillus sp. y28 TaxID=3129110 RepID=UPI003FA71637
MTLNYNGHVYVPIRFIAQSLGYFVHYDEEESTIELSKEALPSHYVERVSNNIDIGASADFIMDLLGEPQLTGPYDSHLAWRYDFLTQENYMFHDLVPDKAGLSNGSVGAQLFLYWNTDKTLSKYEVWYTKGYDQKKKIAHIIVE